MVVESRELVPYVPPVQPAPVAQFVEMVASSERGSRMAGLPVGTVVENPRYGEPRAEEMVDNTRYEQLSITSGSSEDVAENASYGSSYVSEEIREEWRPGFREEYLEERFDDSRDVRTSGAAAHSRRRYEEDDVVETEELLPGRSGGRRERHVVEERVISGGSNSASSGWSAGEDERIFTAGGYSQPMYSSRGGRADRDRDRNYDRGFARETRRSSPPTDMRAGSSRTLATPGRRAGPAPPSYRFFDDAYRRHDDRRAPAASRSRYQRDNGGAEYI
jgi:hypothetical protein